jgi:hypothetical protein
MKITSKEMADPYEKCKITWVLGVKDYDGIVRSYVVFRQCIFLSDSDYYGAKKGDGLNDTRIISLPATREGERLMVE